MTSEPHYVVGRRFTSASWHVDAEQIIVFATQFDPQPFHTDAAASPFGTLIASGWHTASITMKLLIGSGAFAKDDGPGGTLGAGADVKWLRPVLAGDTLTVTSEIVAIARTRANQRCCGVTFRIETRNQRDELVQVMDAKIVVPRVATAASSIADDLSSHAQALRVSANRFKT